MLRNDWKRKSFMQQKSKRSFFPPPHHGIIVVRIPENVPVSERIQEIVNTLAMLSEEDFTDTLITIGKGRFRLRR